ncbi:MAG TPA: hypothetical protein VF134_04420 [Candidatus Dormibacteraeota bacterium]
MTPVIRGLVYTAALALMGAASALPLTAAAASDASPAAGHAYRHGVHVTVEYQRGHRSTNASGSGPLAYGGGVQNVGVTTGAPAVYLVFWGSQWGSQSTDSNGYLNLSGDPNGMAPRIQALRPRPGARPSCPESGEGPGRQPGDLERGHDPVLRGRGDGVDQLPQHRLPRRLPERRRARRDLGR